MAEYIEREAMFKRLAVSPLLTYGIPVYVRNGILDIVAKQHAADVVEVVHGRWELVTTKYFAGQYARVGYCQNCNKERLVDKFCPNCGARMDGDKCLSRVEVPAKRKSG